MSILCKLGIHFRDQTGHIENHGYYNRRITSRSAICKYCGKKLYRIDKFGDRKAER